MRFFSVLFIAISGSVLSTGIDDEDEDKDDGDYKSTGKEDHSTSGSDDLSGEEDEEFDRIQAIHASAVMEGLILPENHTWARKRTTKCRDPTKRRYKRMKRSTTLNSKNPKDTVESRVS